MIPQIDFYISICAKYWLNTEIAWDFFGGGLGGETTVGLPAEETFINYIIWEIASSHGGQDQIN